MEGAALAVENDVDGINNAITEGSPGEAYDLEGADSVAMAEGAELYPAEFLNILGVSGIPPLHLLPKVGVRAILILNLDPAHGRRKGRDAIPPSACCSWALLRGERRIARVYSPPSSPSIRLGPSVHCSPISVPVGRASLFQ